MNKECEYICTKSNGECLCLIHQDMIFCGTHCAYATNAPASSDPRMIPALLRKYFKEKARKECYQ